MAINFKTIFTGLKIKAKAILTSDTKGELEVSDSTGKLNYHDGLTRSPVVTESHSATLTNKTVDADNNTVSNLEVDNLKSGVLNTSTTLTGASNTQIPSALAVKTYVDAKHDAQNEASEITYSNTVSGLAATNAQDAIDEVEARVDTAEADITVVENALQAHITNPSDAHDASAISNDPSGNLAATTVQAALNELQTDIDTRATQSDLANHINQVTDAHDASAISVSPTVDLVSTNVQAALEELQSEVIAASGSAAGVQANLDAHINDTIDAHDASAISVIPTGNLAADDVQEALVELQTDVDTRTTNTAFNAHTSASSGVHGVTGSVVGTSDTQTLTNKTIDADLNTITNIENADIKAGANIARNKLASGTANAIIVNDGTGVLSEMANASNSANAITLTNLKHIELQSQDDATTTGANATLATFTAGGVRITNGSLVSLANIPAGNNGQQFVLFNRTGVSVSIKDASAAIGSAAARILTGTGADITLASNAALILSYDSVSQRWQVVGGSGGGSGSATSAVDNVFTINDATDPTKQINFDAGGATATKTTIAASQTANRTLTLPDVTDTLVSRTSTDTLTNKTIVAANNTITTAASGNLVSTELNASLAELQGDINLLNTNPNYILNNEFSVNVNGWATYSDAAGTSPVDGTGGTANVTFTRTTSTPLFGIASALLTKDAVNRQGQGFSYDFTIDEGMKTKVNTIRFDYQIASGTYATGDLTVWIYDVTNGALIQPAPYQIQNSGIIETFISEFQATTSLSYRLIVHVSSTSASAYTVKFDNFYVGRAPKVYGSVATDWISYTPTFTGFTTTSQECFYKRSGGDILIQCRMFIGSTSATNFRVSLPNGLSISNSLTFTHLVGKLSQNSVNSANQDFNILGLGGLTYVTLGEQSSNSGLTPVNATVLANVATSFFARIPIQGWSSSQQLSQDADTRVVSARYTLSGTQSFPDNTPTVSIWNSLSFGHDTHGGMDTSNGRYYFKVAGKYNFSTGIGLISSIGIASGNRLGLYYRINGGSLRLLQFQIFTGTAAETPQVAGGDTVDVNAGDYIEILGQFDFGSASYSVASASGGTTFFSIHRVSGPSQIAASETVSARYTQSSGQSIPTSSPTVVDFNTKVYDSHNAVTTGSSWRFTAPISGEYSVVSTILFASSAWPIQRYSVIYLRKNGVNYAATPDVVTQVAQTMYFGPYPLTTKVKLLQGEYIDITLEQNRGSATSMHNASTNNWVEINRVGNY